MADDAREKGDRERPPGDEAALSARLKRLGEQLGHIHADHSSEVSPQQPPSADPSAIAAALLELLGDIGRARRLGRAARERALEFTPRRAADETLAFWRRLRDLPPAGL